MLLFCSPVFLNPNFSWKGGLILVPKRLLLVATSSVPPGIIFCHVTWRTFLDCVSWQVKQASSPTIATVSLVWIISDRPIGGRGDSYKSILLYNKYSTYKRQYHINCIKKFFMIQLFNGYLKTTMIDDRLTNPMLMPVKLFSEFVNLIACGCIKCIWVHLKVRQYFICLS